MYQEPNNNVSDIAAANPSGGQRLSAGSMTGREPDVSLRRLDWMGRHAFTARHAVQRAVDPILGSRLGPRHDQSVSHHFASVDSPMGLVYAYDLTWDEFAVLATDVPTSAVDTALGRARAGDAHLTAEVVAGLLAESLTAPTLAAETSAELATRVQL